MKNVNFAGHHPLLSFDPDKSGKQLVSTTGSAKGKSYSIVTVLSGYGSEIPRYVDLEAEQRIIVEITSAATNSMNDNNTMIMYFSSCKSSSCGREVSESYHIDELIKYLSKKFQDRIFMNASRHGGVLAT